MAHGVFSGAETASQVVDRRQRRAYAQRAGHQLSAQRRSDFGGSWMLNAPICRFLRSRLKDSHTPIISKRSMHRLRLVDLDGIEFRLLAAGVFEFLRPFENFGDGLDERFGDEVVHPALGV